MRNIKKYGQYITPAALLLGFVVDTFTLTRIDLFFENLVMLSYLAILTAGIVLMHTFSERTLKLHSGRLEQYITAALALLVPFAFGGLYSGFTIFYAQSASALMSLLFIGILLFVMIGTEYYKKHYLKLPLQVILWYLALFLFLIFYVPILLGSIGAWEFILSGGLSLLGAYGLLCVLERLTPVAFRQYRIKLLRGIVSVFVLINVLYFANIIPPIPLSLKQVDAYYNVTHNASGYTATTEQLAWYSPKRYMRSTLYYSTSDTIYAYSSIFAPTKLNTTVYHQWQYKDETTGEWVQASKIGFTISGGRGDGYRGYTQKSALHDGAWRVRILTERGQLLGTVRFTLREVEAGDKPAVREVGL